MNQQPAGEYPDPYLRWALATAGRYLVHDLQGPLRLAGELRPGCTLRAAAAAVDACGGGLKGWDILGTSFFTATLTSPSPAAFAALHDYARVVLAEPGMKSVDPTGPACEPYAAWERSPGGARRRPAALGQRVVVGVIDGSCAFANNVFDLSPRRSRLDAFWDQGRAAVPGTPWTAPAHLPFGRQLDRQALDAAVQRLARLDIAARAAAERTLYRAIGHVIPDDADWSHGTHVLDTVLRAVRGWTAGQPGVVYVQLPECALRDTSARWASAWVLDAIQYIVDHAAPEAKVVINLSLGAFGGPQDGSSLLERAIDTIARDAAGRIAFVIAAGNAGLIVDDGSGVTKSCHARVVLEAADAPHCADAQKSATLAWDIDVPDSTDSVMELWLPELAGNTADGVIVELRSDSVAALSTGPVEPGSVGFILAADEVIAMVANCSGHGGVPNGSGGMVLVALAHTSSAAGAGAPAGRWFVSVGNRCMVPLTVDARIERRDVPGDLRGFRPQYGFAAAFPHAGSGGTLGSLANGKRTIVVGALAPKDGPDPFVRADYSSEGTGAGVEGCNARTVLRRGPDVYSTGRLDAAGYFSGAIRSLDGTSMAAAQVSGAMAAAFFSAAHSTQQAPLDTLQSFLARGGGAAVRGPGRAYPDSPPVVLRRPAGTSAGGFVVDVPR